jgi:hypothetical protein
MRKNYSIVSQKEKGVREGAGIVKKEKDWYFRVPVTLTRDGICNNKNEPMVA